VVWGWFSSGVPSFPVFNFYIKKFDFSFVIPKYPFKMIVNGGGVGKKVFLAIKFFNVFFYDVWL